MKSDPIYLFQALAQKASLGVLSVAGNVCRMILTEKLDYVKLVLVLVLEFLEDFSSLCEVEEELKSKKRGNRCV
jgi:hypothetical protein